MTETKIDKQYLEIVEEISNLNCFGEWINNISDLKQKGR